ncbi:hypothetical protein KI387_015848, partial [Taxus chinensis]
FTFLKGITFFDAWELGKLLLSNAHEGRLYIGARDIRLIPTLISEVTKFLAKGEDLAEVLNNQEACDDATRRMKLSRKSCMVLATSIQDKAVRVLARLLMAHDQLAREYVTKIINHHEEPRFELPSGGLASVLQDEENLVKRGNIELKVWLVDLKEIIPSPIIALMVKIVMALSTKCAEAKKKELWACAEYKEKEIEIEKANVELQQDGGRCHVGGAD